MKYFTDNPLERMMMQVPRSRSGRPDNRARASSPPFARRRGSGLTGTSGDISHTEPSVRKRRIPYR